MRIGILLTGSYNWAGGLYYSMNIIHALNSLNDTSIKLIVLFNKETPTDLINNLQGISNIDLVNLDKYPVPIKALFRLYRIIFRKNIQLEMIINPLKLDIIFPLNRYYTDLSGLNCRIVYWLYDFQHKFLSDLFSKEELDYRDRVFKEVAEKANDIIVSSNDSFSHFKKFYPHSKARIHVSRFISVTNQYSLHTEKQIRKRFSIEQPYFIVANQFWQHKNHIVVLKAINRISKTEFKVVFTGKAHDHRNPGYFETLIRFVNENNIKDKVLFTGFLERDIQLSLIKHSVAVIQPSKFEGWSTVNEDAKSLKKRIILSAIPVHKEQVPNGNFFNEDDDTLLSEHMLKFLNKTENTSFDQGDYSISEYGNRLKSLFSKIINSNG